MLKTKKEVGRRLTLSAIFYVMPMQAREERILSLWLEHGVARKSPEGG